MKKNIWFFLAIVSFVPVQVSWGGWLESVIERSAERAAERVIDRGARESSDAAYEKTKEGIKQGGQNNPSDDRDDNSGSRPTSNRGDMERQSDNVDSDSSGSSSADEQVYSKYDFIPGDKTIFFDDFSDTDVGEFPRKWTLVGPKPGGNNTVEVVQYQEKRFLRSVPGERQETATQYLRLEQKGDFPEKFTIEFDAVLGTVSEKNRYTISYRVMLVPEDKKIDPFKWYLPGSVIISGSENSSANTKTNVQLNDGRVHHVAISVNGTFVKAYIDNQRVINDPDGVKRPIRQIGLQMLTPNYFRTERLMFTNFRVAEGGKDIKSALATDGKIVTHGILFDTGKDRIKPESLPTLKKILGLLNDDPGLKFSIEGHTDNQGGKLVNQPLSEDRAVAVREWLLDKGVEGSRLETRGLGDTQPLSSNDTAEGRANNRRVEFVRL